ncbi:MAG: carboxypeptidase-like regulatory domain-containing protein [Bacteroides sp.]|nr:carboxypeptidase-like regulatory domain-containing protein [Roseburia sp.]MCM1345661.1 carboxypeptidase-like regulatory domain-containing protein [Bacteroides sp.]MCM1419896.1 carboxypeptidase-like regulatory domain-containing protein [Bacteroides sp.]
MRKVFIIWTLLCLWTHITAAQNRYQIEGYVYEEDKDYTPLHFATVQLFSRDSTFLTGTTSNSEGYFSIAANSDTEYILSVSYIGYDTASIRIPSEGRTDTLRIHLRQSESTLDEITIQAGTVVIKDDRRTIIPNKELARTATDGADILRKANLPGITVNQYSGEIGTYGNGKVTLCINGAKVSYTEIAAIPVEDILRIDFYDSPGARYGDADAVIDYITRHRNSGGNINGDFFNCVGDGKNAAIDHISLKHNQGKSEWSLNTGVFMIDRNNWIRDYDETRVYPDKKVHRQETGSPVAIGQTGIRSNLSYSFMNGDKNFLNIQLSHSFNNAPNSEEGDRKTTLLTSDTDMPVRIYEHLTEKSNSPSMDVYFQHKLNKNQQLIFDVTGTYIRTRSQRTYRENADEELITDVFSDISGNKYSLIAEGTYENHTETHKLTGGIRHLQSYTSNKYAGTTSQDVAMRQAESAVYTEYSRKTGKWGYMGNITLSRIYYGQNRIHTERYSVQPSIRASFSPTEKSYIKYNGNLKNVAPSLSAMNDVEQDIERDMVRRGNPNLKTFHIMTHKLNVGYSGKIIDTDLSLEYRHEFNPIMESVLFENQTFIRTYRNQKAFQQLSAEATIVCHPWKNHLDISIAPIVNRFISKGTDYLHTYTMLRLLWNVDFVYKNWMASYNTLMGPANTMYGEELMEEKNMTMLLVGYKKPAWSIKMGVFNPFMKEYWMETHNWSAIASSVSKAHCNKNMYFTIKLNFNLNYGRQIQHRHKQINNEDTDAGIMQGTKK